MSASPEPEAAVAGLPALDCHAHLAPDVTAAQLRTLAGTVIFAVTRSLAEAATVSDRRDPQLLWGCGVHPGVRAALEGFDRSWFERLIDRFTLVGEVGMDTRAGHHSLQREVFTEILTGVADRPVLVSIHSSGCPEQVVDLLAARPPRGPILHWFTGDTATANRAARAGCFFSVNQAMPDAQLASLPTDRMLPETDYPVVGRRGGPARPGDIRGLEWRLARMWATDAATVRMRLWRNLRQLVLHADVLDRLPGAIADHLIAA